MRRLLLLPLVLSVLAGSTGTALAAKPCRSGCTDTTAPAVSITSPTPGAVLSGTVTVAGSASDNSAVSYVDVAVDAGAWTRASGTISWSLSLSTSTLADGGHTVYARATDGAGNRSVTSVTVTVNNADTVAPTVSVSSPTSGATVSGTTTVTGSAGDNVSVARVDVSVDGGAWQQAAGTTSWSWGLATIGLANGSHTVTARATDGAGNATTSAVAVNVQNAVADTTAPTVQIASPAAGSTVSGTTTVSGSAGDNASVARVDVSVDGGPWQLATGTTSWSYPFVTTSYADGSHTVTARATDGVGNTSTTYVAVTISNSTSTSQHWVSPEGATIDIDSTGGWTVSQVYQMLKDNAAGPGDFARIAPTLTVKVQDVYASSTRASAGTTNGVYTSFSATVYLLGNGGTFPAYPDDVIAHEYGHVWTNFHLFLDRQGDWSRYLGYRWSNSDGSLRLAGDTRLDSSYMWMRAEIIADDYRLLFGTAAAVQQQPTHLNWAIVDPRQVTGLKSFFLTQWAG